MTESEAIKELQVGYLGDTEDLVQAKHIAINALEKQIPKKPIEMKPTDKLLNGYYACPVCHGWVGMDEYSNKYCGCCGNKIDWLDKYQQRKEQENGYR